MKSHYILPQRTPRFAQKAQKIDFNTSFFASFALALRTLRLKIFFGEDLSLFLSNIIVATCFLSTDFAQAQTVYGVRIGFGSTNDQNNDKTESISGYQIGIVREKALCNELLNARIGILFSTKGWLDNSSKISTKLNYIQINPSLKIDLPYFPYWDDMYLQGGLYFGCAISGKKDDQKMYFGRETNKMSFFDYGVTAEFGKQFFDNFQVGLDFQIGLANISNVHKKSEKNFGVMLNTTYMFRKYTTYSNINSTEKTSLNHWFCRVISNKGRLHLHLSLPSIDYVRIIPENENDKDGIGLGVTIGLDYYYSNNQFIHLGTLIMSGSGFNSEKNDTEHLNSDYINLSNNHKIGQFSIGYGLSLVKYTWTYRKFRKEWKWVWPIPPIRIPVRIEEEYVKKSHNALGFIFPLYYQTGRFFNIGLVYRPTFYRPNLTDKFLLEHLVSIDCAWKIRLTL